jgi:hypothetical protein
LWYRFQKKTGINWSIPSFDLYRIMKKQFVKSGYHITTDPQFQNKRFGISPELEHQLQYLAVDSHTNPNSGTIDRLNNLIVRYPTVPQLKNYLSVAFHSGGNHKKAVEINTWILAEHPDYLFARLNEANVCIEENKFEKVPELLGENFEIKALYPDRDLFHLTEVTSFLKTAIRYFVAIDNLELAENRLELLTEIAPEHEDTQQAESFLWPLRMKQARVRMEEENKNRITPTNTKVVPQVRNTTPPHFNHSEIQILYQYGLHIPHEKLKEIILLPRTTVIEDLETILLDAINRYGYFVEQNYAEESHMFVLHAAFLLAELKAETSLPKILSFLEYDLEFLDFWFGDHVTVSIWQFVYVLGFRNTPILKQFLIQPGVNMYSKVCVSEALCQMVLHHPEKREEVLQIYNETFTCFANAKDTDNLIDSEFLGLSISNAIDCKMRELQPIIKILFDKRYVSTEVSGDYEDVAIAFERRSQFHSKRKVYTIFELYENVVSTWAGYNEEGHDALSEDGFEYPSQPIISTKIGRNDPCPCGSGLKYKKCCIDK